MVEWTDALTQFHLLRPWWLLAIPAMLSLLWWGRSKGSLGNWAKVIDPRWLPFMLESRASRKRRQWPWVVATVLAALALSGPTWQQLPQPLHKTQSALVVLLDLSPSMSAQDLKPDRITLAQYKLQDILKLRREGQTALIVYSGSAHVVTPLTDDAATIASQVMVLRPDLISVRGSNIEAAIELAVQLIENSGQTHGDLLLITDGVAGGAVQPVREQLRGKSLRLSVMGVGTADGAPIPLLGGGFAKDGNGNLVVPKLDRRSLMQLARSNGGQYTDLTPDGRDLELLQTVLNSAPDHLLQKQQSKELERTFDSWHDQGYWLALALLPIIVLAFRRGLLVCLLLAPIMLTPHQASAAEQKTTEPGVLQGLWKNAFQTSNQRGQKAFRQQQFQQAQDAFKNNNWKGSAAYRNGDYETALEAFRQDDSAAGFYNQGNALARLGKIDEAIESYRQALQKDPGHEDAAANKKLLEELKNQQQNQQDSQNGEGQQQQQEQEPHQGSDQNDSEQQNQGENSQQQQNSNQQNSQQSSEQEQQTGSSQQQQTDEQQGDQQQQGKQPEQSGEQQDQQSQAQQNTEQTPQDDAEKQRAEQLLRKIPNNPGAFLREKFRRQQRQRQRQNPPQPQDQRW